MKKKRIPLPALPAPKSFPANHPRAARSVKLDDLDNLRFQNLELKLAAANGNRNGFCLALVSKHFPGLDVSAIEALNVTPDGTLVVKEKAPA